ncbi:hypothetical protein ScPMuIL_005086 [Solemya velum]
MVRVFCGSAQYLLSFSKIWILIGIISITEAQDFPTSSGNHFSYPTDNIHLENFVLPHNREVSYYLLHNKSKNFFFEVEESHTPLAIKVIPCASRLEWNVRLLRGGRKRDTKQRGGKRRKKILLESFSGHDAMTFERENSRKGTYMLQIIAMDSDTIIKLYATTNPEFDLSYPSIPPDDRVGITAVSKRSFSLAWKPSPDANFIKTLKYCVAINRKQHYKTHCSLSSHLYGDVKPTFPPGWGFLFSSEVGKKKSIRQKAKPIKPVRSGSIVYTCIGNKTHFTFKKARPGRTYLVDVFLVNNETNLSSTYSGSTVRTRDAHQHLVLQDGKLFRKSIRSRNVPEVFHFEVNKLTKELLIFIQPCSGSVNLKVGIGANITFQAKVDVQKRFILKDVEPGLYLISIYGARGQHFRIKAKTGVHRLRYPKLPARTEVRILENLTTCNSITLAWMGTKGKQTYCLYKRTQLEENESKTNKKYNQCLTPTKTMQKIQCTKLRHRHSGRAVVSQKVTDLQPGVAHTFDVFVRRGRRNYLHYKTSIAKTKDVCDK